LREINVLEYKQKNGVPLSESLLAKINQKQELEKKLEELKKENQKKKN